MKKTLLASLFVIVLLVLHTFPEAAAQQKKSEHPIADFEGKNPITTGSTTHKASVTMVDDVPEGGGKYAAKTVVDDAAGATSHFGTGFGFPTLDLSGADEIRFWIKTDMESGFNFQIHSGKDNASVFRFSTVDSKPGTWQQITAPVASFTLPPWAKGNADWASVKKWQVTAFGSGPYDGRYIILDNVTRGGQRIQPASAKPAVMDKKDGPVQRGEPINPKQAESSSAPTADSPTVFKKLHQGVNMDTARPDSGTWPSIQHDVAHFEAAADAGFKSVRVFLPYGVDHKSTEQQVKDALSNDLAIVVCMWGSEAWPRNTDLGVKQIAARWRELAQVWKDYPEDLVFEILNEPEGIGFVKADGAQKVMPLYNAAIQAIRDVDPDRPILIGAPGYNDSEFLEPFVTEEYLTYQFDGGKGFYDDSNTGVAIHFYSPKHDDGLNFAMWTQPLWGDESQWKDPITRQITNAVEWRESIGVDIPIITTEWGCWLFPKRSAEDVTNWLDHHLHLFDNHNVGNMWYTGLQNNQRSFGILNSELGWNQTVLDKLTGAKPSTLPKISQVINGEFFNPDQAWRLTSDKITREYVYGKRAFSGSSMLKLTVPGDAEGQLYLQTYRGNDEYKGAPGRTLIHLIKGQTYRISFIAASEDGEGRIGIQLKDAKTMDTFYDSYETVGDWISVGKEPRTYTRLYTHNAETEMDARLSFNVGSRQQVLYLDKVELIRK